MTQNKFSFIIIISDCNFTTYLICCAVCIERIDLRLISTISFLLAACDFVRADVFFSIGIFDHEK